MKKWITLLLLAALVGTLTLTAHAADGNLRVASVEVKPGETAYLKLELTQSTVGDAVGVAFEYDDSLLKPLESSCTWAREGLLQDFDTENGKGVWAVAVASDQKGLVCTLAFEVIAMGHFETKVDCTVIVKNGSAEVGTFTTSATIMSYCEHAYGNWEDIGIWGHTHVCKYCDRHQTQSHNWDNGKMEQMENKPDMAVTTFTCRDCGATQKTEHEYHQKPTAPTQPPEGDPTEPDHTYPTKPGYTEDHTFPTFPNTQPTHPTHGIPTHPTQGGHDHDHATTPVQDDHGHDHSTTGKKTENENALILLATVAVLGGLAWFFLRKK